MLLKLLPVNNGTQSYGRGVQTVDAVPEGLSIHPPCCNFSRTLHESEMRPQLSSFPSPLLSGVMCAVYYEGHSNLSWMLLQNTS